MADKVFEEHFLELVKTISQSFTNDILSIIENAIELHLTETDTKKPINLFAPAPIHDGTQIPPVSYMINVWFGQEYKKKEITKIYFDWLDIVLRELEEKNKSIYERHNLRINTPDFSQLLTPALNSVNPYPINSNIMRFFEKGQEIVTSSTFKKSTEFLDKISVLRRWDKVREIPWLEKTFGYLRFAWLAGLILEISTFGGETLYTEMAIKKYVKRQKPKLALAVKSAVEPQIELSVNSFKNWAKMIHARAITLEVSPPITILFLAAEPTNASRLRLGNEFDEIEEQLRLAKWRDHFKLELPKLSLRPKDISDALLNAQPQIVHFSGHGTSEGKLCFENETGQSQLVQPDALAALFEQFADQVNCVLLNACYSEIQANSIARHINHVIGMNKEIGDNAAIAFSIGFYQALGAGRTIEEAYNLGCIQIRLQGIPEHLTPVLIKKKKPKSKDDAF
jgi:hypothetical protein